MRSVLVLSLAVLFPLSTAFSGELRDPKIGPSNWLKVNSVFAGNGSIPLTISLPQDQNPHPPRDPSQHFRGGQSGPKTPPKPFTDKELKKELEVAGLMGYIHGYSKEKGMYLLMIQNPDPRQLFDRKIIALRPAHDAAVKHFDKLNAERHDLVHVSGAWEDGEHAPHIDVETLRIMIPDQTSYANTELEKSLPLNMEPGKEYEIQAMVHGVLRGGKQVALEYKNNILPLTLKDPNNAKHLSELNALWRGDVIKLRVKVRKWPVKPLHLMYLGHYEVVEPVRDFYKGKVDFTGSLVLFPKSPVLVFRSFALAVKSKKTGITRYFSLVRMKDRVAHKVLKAKLAKLWEDNLGSVKQGRNKFINPAVQLRVKGKVPHFGPLGQNQGVQLIEVEQWHQKLNKREF